MSGRARRRGLAYNSLVQSWRRSSGWRPTANTQARFSKQRGIIYGDPNHERVGKAMELLKSGVGPIVERELQNVYKDRAAAQAERLLGDDRLNAKLPVAQWDAAALLKLMWESWNDVFRMTLGHTERSLVSELRDHRNKWAHQHKFPSDDTYRVLDSAGRLLAAVSAREADEIEKMKTELLRLPSTSGGKRRKTAGTAIGSAAANLKPWRGRDSS